MAGALPSPFTAREVFLKGWTRLTAREEIRDALDRLEALAWVRRRDVRHPTGRRPTQDWVVNPRVRRP